MIELVRQPINVFTPPFVAETVFWETAREWPIAANPACPL